MKINNATKVGIMVAIVVAVLIVMTVKSGNLNVANKGYHLKIQFKNIDGVNMNSPVMVNGFEVGIVDDVKLIDVGEETRVELMVWLREDVKLRKGTQAFVKNLGFMGEKYLGLISAGKNEPFLSPDSIIIGEEPQDFQEMVKNGKEISIQLKEISQKINTMLAENDEKIDAILANADQTVSNLSSITKNVDERLQTNKASFDEIMINFKDVSVNLEEMSQDLKRNPWKIMYKSKEK